MPNKYRTQNLIWPKGTLVVPVEVSNTPWFMDTKYTVMQDYYQGDTYVYVYSKKYNLACYASIGGGMHPSDYRLHKKVATKRCTDADYVEADWGINTKPTNPKDAVGIKKAPMSTLPANVLMELSLALMEGARKYGRHNYRAIGVRSSVYYDAAMRHLMDWWEGVDNDKDSGLSHIVKAMACLVVLRDSMHQGNLNDDRPPASPEGWLEELNKKAEALIDKYPESKEAITRESTQS